MKPTTPSSRPRSSLRDVRRRYRYRSHEIIVYRMRSNWAAHTYTSGGLQLIIAHDASPFVALAKVKMTIDAQCK